MNESQLKLEISSIRNASRIKLLPAMNQIARCSNGIMWNHLRLILSVLYITNSSVAKAKHHVMSSSVKRRTVSKNEHLDGAMFGLDYSTTQICSFEVLLMWWAASKCFISLVNLLFRVFSLHSFVDWHESGFYFFITIQTSERIQMNETAFRMKRGRNVQGRLTLCFVVEHCWAF